MYRKKLYIKFSPIHGFRYPWGLGTYPSRIRGDYCTFKFEKHWSAVYSPLLTVSFGMKTSTQSKMVCKGVQICPYTAHTQLQNYPRDPTNLLTLKESGSVPAGGGSICFAYTKGALPIHVPVVVPAAPPTSPHFGALFVLSTCRELHFVERQCFFFTCVIHLDCLFFFF